MWELRGEKPSMLPNTAPVSMVGTPQIRKFQRNAFFGVEVQQLPVVVF